MALVRTLTLIVAVFLVSRADAHRADKCGNALAQAMAHLELLPPLQPLSLPPLRQVARFVGDRRRPPRVVLVAEKHWSAVVLQRLEQLAPMEAAGRARVLFEALSLPMGWEDPTLHPFSSLISSAHSFEYGDESRVPKAVLGLLSYLDAEGADLWPALYRPKVLALPAPEIRAFLLQLFDGLAAMSSEDRWQWANENIPVLVQARRVIAIVVRWMLAHSIEQMERWTALGRSPDLAGARQVAAGEWLSDVELLVLTGFGLREQLGAENAATAVWESITVGQDLFLFVGAFHVHRWYPAFRDALDRAGAEGVPVLLDDSIIPHDGEHSPFFEAWAGIPRFSP